MHKFALCMCISNVHKFVYPAWAVVSATTLPFCPAHIMYTDSGTPASPRVVLEYKPLNGGMVLCFM